MTAGQGMDLEAASSCQGEQCPGRLTFRPLDQAAARAIYGWRYDPPYDVYDLAAGPAEEVISALLDPRNAYYGLYDEGGTLVAFCCFGPDARVPGGDYSPEALDIGLGVRPDLTGQGHGGDYVRAVLDFACRTWPATTWRVTIASFNGRARRVWQKAGFQLVEMFARPGDGLAFGVLVSHGPERPPGEIGCLPAAH